ncbi:AraC family transcriptional regulator [Terriglobus saanensis]|uniref:Transcriptional regulator, AraC family n=1 Tax=Terriglobus saanensis (strain ATCC BAA-1853 / DSM 23119 / SP1PR4) TaxID=401053 RepID=E8UXQ8_TERSS|nr:helix-turn-helix domain-containing protein [Terriglobus saanensis]ADV83074.1 transcriptional regulator, AraC family [Terriglobus saanensis SP1PR4]
MVGSISDSESKTFDSFLLGPSVRTLWNCEFPEKGFSIGKYSTVAGEQQQAITEQHRLAIWRGTGAVEFRNALGEYIPQMKRHGPMNFFPAGIVPAMRRKRQSDFILFTLEPWFVKNVSEQMEQRPTEDLQLNEGFRHQPLHQLTTLLSIEAAQGGMHGSPYTDHLMQALTMELLLLVATERKPTRFEKSGLSQPILRRVVERMQDLSADLDLKTLASEIGYSQSHFLRIFQAATGQTPYQYLLDLRLARAQDLIRSRRVSMIDIASTCGFSSHSHMSRIFRQIKGFTPSEYRRNL